MRGCKMVPLIQKEWSYHNEIYQLLGFENMRANTGWVKNFSGPLSGPRGHKPKEQFLKMVDV